MDSFRSSQRQMLVSTRRSRELAGTHGTFSIDSQPPGPPMFPANSDKLPPVWPAVLVCFLHNISMGAAMMVWIDVCRTAYRKEQLEGDEDSKSLPQTLYGRLLAVNAVCELLTSNLIGVASDTYGRRLLQASAQFGQLIDYTAAALCLPAFGIVKWAVIPTHWVSPLLFVTRGVAGLLGNFRVSLQSYTADISTPEDCPSNMAYVGAALVVGMCMGSGMVAAISGMEITLRACYFLSVLANLGILCIVKFVWRDIAPRRPFKAFDTNPLAGIGLIMSSTAMVIYASLVFLSSFALSIFTSTFTFYCEEFLKMDKISFTALGAEWAFLSAISLSLIQPYLTASIGEITTLRLAFLITAAFYILFSFVTEGSWTLAYVMIAFFSFGSMAYPIAVGLASREVDPGQQGKLQGSLSVLENIAKIVAPVLASDVLIPMFDQPDQYNGLVYLVAGLLLLPGVIIAGCLRTNTTYVSTGVECPKDSVGSIELPDENWQHEPRHS